MHFHIENASAADKDAIDSVLRHWNMHHALEKEADRIDLMRFFVARAEGLVVGVAGYELISDTTGKTRLLAVMPSFEGAGIGKALQERRLEAMHAQGVMHVVTHSSRLSSIVWYKKHFGYTQTGKIEKPYAYGEADVTHTTVLELDLARYMAARDTRTDAVARYIEANDPPPLSSYQPLIINVALTGVIPTRLSSPHVPLSEEEIIADAVRVCDAGASIVHLHARDVQGVMTSDAAYYGRIIAGIRRERPELICCATTSGRGGQSFETRAEVLHLSGDAKPDMGSLTLGSLNFLTGPSINALETVQGLALLMQEKGILPEMEIFDTGMINAARYLERHGMLPETTYFNILLGNLNTAPATMRDLAHIVEGLLANSVWAAGGLGGFQLPVNLMALAAGGHVRVGLEDNIHFDLERRIPASNVMLVERIAHMAASLGRPVATPRQTRDMLGLPQRCT